VPEKYFLEFEFVAQCCWFMSVILATHEAEIRRITV
jgi:hypothetical protein